MAEGAARGAQDNLEPQAKPLTKPRQEPDILKADVFGGGHGGPESQVNAVVKGINTEYGNAVGENIAGGFFGALGYVLGGDEGSFKGAGVDQAAVVALGGLKSSSNVRQKMAQTNGEPITAPPTGSANATTTNKLDVQTTGKLQGVGINGNIKMGGSTRLHGEFDFVINSKSTLLLGSGHSYLSGGENVQAAGRIRFRNSQIVRINNASGHYMPSMAEGLGFLGTFKKSGFNVDRAHLQLYNPEGRIELHITPNSAKRNLFLH
jgi:hypothetical protein